MRVPMEAKPSTQAIDDHVLGELRALREQLAALTAELQLRTRKRKAHTRAKTLANRAVPAVHVPSELDIARARRLLR